MIWVIIIEFRLWFAKKNKTKSNTQTYAQRILEEQKEKKYGKSRLFVIGHCFKCDNDDDDYDNTNNNSRRRMPFGECSNTVAEHDHSAGVALRGHMHKHIVTANLLAGEFARQLDFLLSDAYDGLRSDCYLAWLVPWLSRLQVRLQRDRFARL